MMQRSCAFAGTSMRPAAPTGVTGRRPAHMPIAPMAVLEQPRVQGSDKVGAFPSTQAVGRPLERLSSSPEPLALATPPQAETALQVMTPGQADDAMFQKHWSVAFWRARNSSEPDALQKTVRLVTESSGGAGVFPTASAAAYWSYHVGRSTFFMLQGALGLLAGTGMRSLSGQRQDEKAPVYRLSSSLATYAMSESLAMFYQDFKNIQEGRYKMPWDMTTPRHRQYNPLFVARAVANFFSEATTNLQRQKAAQTDDIWLQSDMYPSYYLNTFHYQTDGWLSAKSAKVYENSTETLFLGRQDAMQRQTLVPLGIHLALKGNPLGTGLQALELACGTGRFATFLKDNFPEMEITAQDLSPYYLAEARSNAEHWRDLRQPGKHAGGYKGTGFNFLQAAAEAIPVADGTFDVVTCVYLFHELPEDVRKAVVAEMARVVKPGGIVILTDSIQLGDRPHLDANLGRFGRMNEPYFETYIRTNLGEQHTLLDLTRSG